MDKPEDTTEGQEEHAFLMEDLAKAEQRVSKAKFIEAKNEFRDNAYPLMQTMADHFGARIVRLEQAMDALIDGSDSLIQPELADQILATLELGKVIADEVAKMKAGVPLDDTTAKRLQGQAAAYLTAFELTAEAVEEHTTSDESEEAGDPEGDADEAVEESNDEPEGDSDE
jgi:hypothetical protein